jgi:molecular chaperone GrpE
VSEQPITSGEQEVVESVVAPPDNEATRQTDLENQLRHALADLDNVRKRYQRELTRERASERARVAVEWVPIVDNLERALEHVGDDEPSVLEGVRAVRDQAVAALARLGFPRFEAVGEPFDAHRHEALTVVADDAAPGTVVATVRPGYGKEEEILRPAGVVVSRGSE